MKKIKLVLIVFIIFLMTGCYEKSSMENANIRVSSYPIEYVTKRLYGEHSDIKSIYPDNMDNDYVVSDKLITDYSSSHLFIFNGNEDNENDYVYKMFNENKNLKIIDATASLTYTNKIEELWLDPMNLLTIANNIKKGFKEYISMTYLNNDIDKNYEQLKLELIQLEADYREMANRANNKTIIVGNDLFLYLSKYGINVISLEESNNFTKKNLYTAEELIQNGQIKYIYIKKGEEINQNINDLKNKYNIEIIELNSLYTITEDDRKNNNDYLTIMYSNLELLKQQLYA